MTRDERKTIFWIGTFLCGMAGLGLSSTIGYMLNHGAGGYLGLATGVMFFGALLILLSFRRSDNSD